MPTLPGGTGIVPTQLAGTTSPTTSTSVFLSNLPPDVDDTVLCQLVRPYGTVQSAHTMPDDTSSTRCAAVTMTSVDEALRLLAAFNGRMLGDCVIQATLTASQYATASNRSAAGSVMALQPVVGLLPSAAGAYQTLLLHNTVAGTATGAVNGDVMVRQCLPQTYPAQTYELVQLPIM